MDSSGEELGRIVAFVNRRPWIMEEDSCEEKSNYFLDTLGTTPEGDTGLMRLCAWQVTLEQLQDFLKHLNCESNTTSVTQSNHAGVTCLHLAVYRNSYHAPAIVRHLLQLEPSLASNPMQCGSYPLHVLCGLNMTIQKEVFLALLQADPSVVLKQDRNGDTPLSLLWKNVQRFRWARQTHISLEEPTHSHKQLMTISPAQCLEFSLRMIQAALHKNSALNLADICSMPRCPPLLVQLVVQHANTLQLDLYGTSLGGRTALHHAAANEPMTQRFTLPRIHTPSVLECLLDALPSLACVKDQWGRIPLHYYAASPVSSYDQQLLERLVSANPDSLCTKDPLTGLYPFALLAARDDEEDDDEEDCIMQDMDDEEQDCTHLSAIVGLLRQFPEAAIY